MLINMSAETPLLWRLNRLVDRIWAELIAKKYIIMPVPRVFSPGLLLLAALLVPTGSQAGEIEAIQQQAKQNPDAALKRVNAYLYASPQDLQALFTKGLILLKQKRTEDAIKAFIEITQKYPGRPEPYNNLAVLYANQGHYDQAKIALESALKTNPSYATAYQNLSEIYAQMASEAYDKALQLDSNPRSKTRLALIANLHAPSEKPLFIAKPAEAIKSLSDKPTPLKTSTLALPARMAEEAKVVAVKAPEIKTAETKPVEAKSVQIKPAVQTTEPEKAKTELVKSAIETAPTLKKPADNAVFVEKEIITAVKQWAKAWAAQDVPEYLASYADNFEPASGQSRQAWQETRRERVSAPAHIQVDVSNLNVNLDDEKTARVIFRQAYRTGQATMRTDKVLIMKKADNKWLIQQELTDR